MLGVHRHLAGAAKIRALRRVRAFTLLESLIAATLMGVVVLAVITGITTAQQVSFEGQKRILASLSADDLMLELVTVPYAQLISYNGLDQPIGQIRSLDGAVYPSTYAALGRSVQVESVTYTEPSLGVTIRGVRIGVTVRDQFRDLLTVETFVAEPSS